MGRTVAGRTALIGLLFALALVLSAVENMLPSFFPLPGIKLGLSNVVTMYCVFVLGARKALVLAGLKALSVLLLRGTVAAFLSACGGMMSVLVMVVLLRGVGKRASYGGVSMAGAVFHNVGQLLAASLLLGLGRVFWYYLPLLVVAGILMGLLTSVLLRAILPLLRPLEQNGHHL